VSDSDAPEPARALSHRRAAASVSYEGAHWSPGAAVSLWVRQRTCKENRRGI